MPVVTFSYSDFIANYPEFSAVSSGRATGMFTIAEQSLLDNTDNSPVADIPYRTQLFYMLVGHLLLILGPVTPSAPDNTPPGRISSATEGTVTSQFEYLLPSGSSMSAWYVQTKYGALFWTSTARFRSAIMIANGQSGIGIARAYGQPLIVLPGGI